MQTIRPYLQLNVERFAQNTCQLFYHRCNVFSIIKISNLIQIKTSLVYLYLIKSLIRRQFVTLLSHIHCDIAEEVIEIARMLLIFVLLITANV